MLIPTTVRSWPGDSRRPRVPGTPDPSQRPPGAGRRRSRQLRRRPPGIRRRAGRSWPVRRERREESDNGDTARKVVAVRRERRACRTHRDPGLRHEAPPARSPVPPKPELGTDAVDSPIETDAPAEREALQTDDEHKCRIGRGQHRGRDRRARAESPPRRPRRQSANRAWKPSLTRAGISGSSPARPRLPMSI